MFLVTKMYKEIILPLNGEVFVGIGRTKEEAEAVMNEDKTSMKEVYSDKQLTVAYCIREELT